MSPRCPRCLVPRSYGSVAGLCPGCLLGNAMDFGFATPDSSESEETARMIDSPTDSLGPMPRVFLADACSEAVESPLVRPSSKEMPSEADRSPRIQLLGEIARGGMGAILKGRDPDLGRDLVVKVLLNVHCDKPDFVRRFVEEAQINCQLQHPGIVPVYGLGTFGDSRPYFTMKLVKGWTLAELLTERPHPADDRPRFLAILLQVAQTVAYTHARRVIHRDIKPSNIMVGSFGEVLLMDWGLAKILPRGGVEDDASAGLERPKNETVITTNTSTVAPNGDHSEAGSILGTPSYMAPEQARGEVDQLDERCDVFALGSILAEVLTGLPAFSGRNSGEIVRKSQRGDLAEAFARLDGSGADPAMVALAKNCLAAEPEDRPADAQYVADRLLDHINSIHRRLREAELAQAAEHARAEEAKRTAAAESARAEEALRAAESAEARARVERQARRLQVGLAASLIGLMTLGGGGYAMNERQKAERGSKTARAVDEALAESDLARSEAQSAPIGELGKWDEAISALKKAEALVTQGEADTSTRSRVTARLDRLDGERAEARAKSDRMKADRNLLAVLESIRGQRAVYNDLKRTSRDYVTAFRKAGLDFDKTEPAEAGLWVTSRSEPSEIVGYLDDWASVSRRATGTGESSWRRVVEASRAADRDPWRDAIRVRFGAGYDDSPAEFRRMADNLKTLDAQPAASLVLLARELVNLGNAADRERAAKVLRRAAIRHPADFWARFELGILYWEQDTLLQAAEAVRHMTAATAIRPGSSSAHGQLGRLLKLDKDQLDEAVGEFREAIRLGPTLSLARIELSDTFHVQGKLDEAIALCQEEIRLHPDNAWAHANLGRLFKDQGKLEMAFVEFREAVRLEPDRTDAIVELVGIPTDRPKVGVAAILDRPPVPPNPIASATPNQGGNTLKNADPLLGKAIDQAVVDLVKEATVFIKIKAGPVEGNGSGFVIKNNGGDSVLILTNRHVAAPDAAELPEGAKAELSVVFRSGTGQEQELPARLIAYDGREVRDLAVLEVKGVRNPPRPLAADAPASEADFYETMPAYALGYPLGGMIVGNTKANPAITVNAMAISSLRRDETNKLTRIQLAGSIIQGNSGGPIVDARGRLVGVVVSRITGESVGFAIPPGEIGAFLAGDIGEILNAELLGSVGPEIQLKLLLGLVDPLNRIKSVSIRYARQADIALVDTMKPKPGGGYPELPGGTNVPLMLQEGTAGGTVVIPTKNPEDRKIVLQFLASDSNGRVIASTKPIVATLPDRPGIVARLDNEQTSKTLAKWSTEANVGDGIKMTHRAGSTTIDLPGGLPLNNAPQYNLFNAPCALVKVEGDFLATVDVKNTFDPGGEGVVLPSGRQLPFSFQSAGLLIWQDEKNFVRLERSKGSDGEKGMVNRVLLEVYKNGREAAVHYIDIPETPVILAARRKGGSIQLLFATPPKQLMVFQEIPIDFKNEVFVGVAAANLSKRPFQAKLDNFQLKNLAGQEIVAKPYKMTKLVAVGMVRRPDGTLVFEGASLKVSNPADAPVAPQDMAEFKGEWSDNKQLLWSNNKAGQTLTLELPIDANGKYEIKGRFTRSPDYGIVKLEVDGMPLYKGYRIDFYDKEVRPTSLMSLGTLELKKGVRRLTITVFSKNPNSSGFRFGLDEIQLVPAR